jgi:hypothetical protein
MILLSDGDIVRDDSLLLYFDPAIAGSQFNGNGCFDLSGEGHHGISADGSPATSTDFGGTLVMDGLNDQVKFDHTTVSNTNGSWSVSAFVKYTSLTNQNSQSTQQYITFGPFNDGAGLSVGKRNGKHCCWGSGGVIMVISSSSPVVGVWYNVAYTFDGTTHKIYVDGVLTGTGTVTANATVDTKVVLSGWRTPTSGMGSYRENFYGQHGPFMVYNKTLTPQEVEQNFNVFRGRYGI